MALESNGRSQGLCEHSAGHRAVSVNCATVEELALFF